ncbi:hypothetical protein [Faecalispora anaeroviscerum]|uniref:hypothetical protein n=1 Tax=Faecalispora anaeroviscerum TaxID=2991836 RepID=UPI0024BAF7D7|nr:hypothetical protein [Faecalispora anaeroviscerum]
MWMEKNRSKIRFVFWLVLIVGSALLGVGLAAFSLDRFTKNMTVAVWLAILSLTSIGIDLLWYRELNRKLMSLQSVLLEEHDADRYISEINALLEGKKSPHIRSIFLLNLSAAYCEKAEYHTAQDFLLQINPRKLTGINRSVYWANLAYVYFYLKEEEKAQLILEQQRAAFAKLSDHPQLGALLVVLGIFERLAQGDRPGARERLERERPRWETEHTASDFAYLDQLC